MYYDTLVSVGQLGEHLDHPGWVIVDCRFSLAEPDKGESEYRQGHIPGSYYAHLDRDLSSPVIPGVTGRHPLPEVSKLVEKIRAWGVSPNSQVIAYDHAGGGIASRLWWLLRWLGHEKVAVLDGGWKAWIQAGKAISDTVPAFKEGSFEAKMNEQLTMDADQVDIIRTDQQWSLVDSREPNRYLGLEEPIDPVAGHIEGAVNHFFGQNVDEAGRWRSPEVVKSLLQQHGVGAHASRTVFYCGSGVTACHNILAYKHAGLGDALLYPGSWSEWINRK